MADEIQRPASAIEGPGGAFYMRAADGGLVPLDAVKPAHLLEDELVRRLAGRARAISVLLAAFREDALAEVDALRALVAEEYGATLGGAKGNVTLSSYDGALRLQVSVGETISFGSELGAAKDLIDECVRDWSSDSRSEVRALIEHAFQVNKVGRIDTGRVLGLRSLDIEDERWKRAMEAIGDAVRKTVSKRYFRAFERRSNDDGPSTPIPLDIARVSAPPVIVLGVELLRAVDAVIGEVD